MTVRVVLVADRVVWPRAVQRAWYWVIRAPLALGVETETRAAWFALDTDGVAGREGLATVDTVRAVDQEDHPRAFLARVWQEYGTLLRRFRTVTARLELVADRVVWPRAVQRA